MHIIITLYYVNTLNYFIGYQTNNYLNEPINRFKRAFLVSIPNSEKV
jgi:hypothetical protein